MKKISARAYFLKKTFDMFVIGLLMVMLLFIWTLYKGPISVPYLKPYIVQALNYDEHDYQVDIGDVSIELVRSIQPLRVTAKNINLQKKDETVKISAPKLYMSFSLRALMKGLIAPSIISLENPTVYVFASYGVDDDNKNEVNKKKIEYYITRIKEMLDNYNSEDKIYPESYVNNIAVKSGEVEFHEVDLGRKWILSDVNFEFNRNLINMEVNANALVNINDKIASIGVEGEYHASTDQLDAEVYFSDLILSDLFSTLNETTEDNLFSVMSIEVPVNGKVSTTLRLAEILQHPEEAEDYLDGAIEKIDFELDSGHGHIAFEGEEKYNYAIDEMQLAGHVVGGIDELQIENAEFRLAGQKANVSVHASGLESYYLEQSLRDVAIRVKAEIGEFPLDKLSQFWPRYAAEPAWQWCKDGLVGGMAKNGDFTFDIGYDKQSASFGLLSLRGTAQLNDGDIDYLTGMPPVHKVYGTAHFSQQNILIDIDKGISDGLMITGGQVNIYDLNKDKNYISIHLIGQSSVEDALTLIDHQPLQLSSSMGINPKNFQGNVDIKLKLDFELRRDLKGRDIKVDVDADLHEIKITEILPNHTISSDNVHLKVTSDGWKLEGEGKFDGVPLKLSMKEKFAEKKYKSKCNISFKLDDEAKKVLGIDWAILKEPSLSGYVVVNADVVVQNNDLIDVQLTADLQHTKMDYAYLGFVKETGVPANVRAHAILNKDKIQSVQDIALHKENFDMRGRIEMYPSGRVKLIDIGQISAPKTSARAKVSLSDAERAYIKVDVSGSSYNLKPLFDKSEAKSASDEQRKIVQQNEDDGLEKVNNTDMFISVNSLWTNDSTPIKNFAGTAKLRYGIGLDEMHLVGNYGIDKSIKLNLDYIPRGKNEHYLSIDSNNAGSTLKVLRLYDNMVGGTLKIEARRDVNKKFIGHATVRDFSIRDAPVMAQLLSVASLTGVLDLLRGDGLTFTHFSAPFEYQYKILKLKQAKAEGSVLSITTNGRYNRASDELNMQGAIAPAYSLNRLLGKIPVVGNLLAGRDGTIFAADYKISGTVDKSEIDINSLSMLSPNSMKEWYRENFGDGDEY